MSDATLSFDHVHLVAKDPAAAARWYVDKLGGKVWKSADVRGAPQVYVQVAGALVILRGERSGESVQGKTAIEWGVDHFGLRVHGDFDAFCNGLRAKGVGFDMEPRDFNETTRIAFIKAPDGVSIELLNRKDVG
jgi:catechol 2,3-dioxygenase-like lactoylglutathione lyase family enzyme